MSNKEQFSTGAQRDNPLGKGRYTAISPFATSRKAIVMEKGEHRYDELNWAKGMPLGRCLDSALRHLQQHLAGDKSEDHLAQCSCNLDFIMHYETLINSGLLDSVLDTRPDWTRIPLPTRWRIYVAGPYSDSSDDVREHNRDHASSVGLSILNLGHFSHVPHNATGPYHGELPWSSFMALDRTYLETWATHLFFLDSSPGTDLEKLWAEELGLLIITDLKDIPNLGGPAEIEETPEGSQDDDFKNQSFKLPGENG